MKQVRVSALRKAQGAFLLLHEHEFAALEPLPLWFTRLFLVLLRCADFKTGAGQVGYPYLAQCLQPEQPERGPRHFAPTAQACKRAVVELEQRRIVARDKAHSDSTKSLFFSVAPRYAQVRPPRNSTPQLDPHPSAAKPALARPAARQAEKLDPSTRPPLTAAGSFIVAPSELSTERAPQPSRFVREVRAVVEATAARRGGKK